MRLDWCGCKQDQLTSTRSKLEEAKEQLSSSEQMVRWLNTQVGIHVWARNAGAQLPAMPLPGTELADTSSCHRLEIDCSTMACVLECMVPASTWHGRLQSGPWVRLHKC